MPWKTISYATRHSPFFLSPGDTLYVRGGHYQGNTNVIDLGGGIGNSGTPASPVAVSAYPGEIVLITDVSAPEYGVVLKNKSSWVIAGLTWSNIYGGALFENCTNIVVTNCTFTTMRPDATNGNYQYSCVWFSQSSQSNVFINSTVYNWGTIFTNKGSANQWQIAGTPIALGNYGGDGAPFTAFAYYNLVQGCRFYRCGHDLFQLNTGFNVIRSNLFYNDAYTKTNRTTGWQYYNYGNPRSAANVLGMWGARITKPGGGDNDFTGLGTNYNTPDLRTVFEGNTMLYAALPPDSNSGVAVELATRLGIYRNNVIAFCQGGGIYLNHSGSATWATPRATNSPAYWHQGVRVVPDYTQCAMSTLNSIYNNTIYGNGSMIPLGTPFTFPASGVDLNTYLNGAVNNYIVNNIIWGNAPTNVGSQIYLYETWRTNYCGDYGLPDPRFVSTNGAGFSYAATLPDFHLLPTSPCIGRGQFLARVASPTGGGTAVSVDNSLYFSDGNYIVQGDLIELQGHTAIAVVVRNDWTNNVLYLDRSITWTNGQGITLKYSGAAPDMGAFEAGASNNVPAAPQGLRIGP